MLVPIDTSCSIQVLIIIWQQCFHGTQGYLVIVSMSILLSKSILWSRINMHTTAREGISIVKKSRTKCLLDIPTKAQHKNEFLYQTRTRKLWSTVQYNFCLPFMYTKSLYFLPLNCCAN